jgi:hypothetical protein
MYRNNDDEPKECAACAEYTHDICDGCDEPICESHTHRPGGASCLLFCLPCGLGRLLSEALRLRFMIPALVTVLTLAADYKLEPRAATSDELSTATNKAA